MTQMTRCGVSLESGLLKKLDKVVADAGYRNRSAALREIIRDYLVREDWDSGRTPMACVVSLVFHRKSPEVLRKLTDIKAIHRSFVTGDTFYHLHEDYSVNIVLLHGTQKDVRAIADSFLGCRGVVHGTVTPMNPGPPCK